VTGLWNITSANSVKRTGYDLMTGFYKCDDELLGSIRAGDFFTYLVSIGFNTRQG
jgi:hypothetical protein